MSVWLEPKTAASLGEPKGKEMSLIGVMNARSIAKHLLTNGHEPDPVGNIINGLCDEVEAKQAEIERLQGAIRQALDHRYGDWTGILEASLDRQGPQSSGNPA